MEKAIGIILVYLMWVQSKKRNKERLRKGHSEPEL